MSINKLSDAFVRKTTAAGKYNDGGGLYLWIKIEGGPKYWLFRFKFEGQESSLTFGKWTSDGRGVTLEEARNRAAEQRLIIRNATHPLEEKRQKKILRHQEELRKKTFRDAVADLLWSKRSRKVTKLHCKQFLRSIHLGAPSLMKKGFLRREIENITAPEVIEICRSNVKRGTSIPRELAKDLRSVFKHAVLMGWIKYNPIQDSIACLLPKHDVTHFASLPYGPEFSDLLRRIDDYPAKLSNKLALKFLMLSFLRTVEIRLLRWDWVDWKREIINIPAEAMKKRYPHMVVCSPQMMDILRRAFDLNSRYELIFPSTENKEIVMSSDTLRRIIERCGFKGRQTGHGFRSLAASTMQEYREDGRLRFSREVIKRHLSHRIGDDVDQAYLRAEFLSERRELSNAWAMMVDAARNAPSTPGSVQSIYFLRLAA